MYRCLRGLYSRVGCDEGIKIGWVRVNVKVRWLPVLEGEKGHFVVCMLFWEGVGSGLVTSLLVCLVHTGDGGMLAKAFTHAMIYEVSRQLISAEL